LAAGNTFVFVTYNCAPGDRGSEEQVAVQTVGTLRPRATGVELNAAADATRAT
jgi:hypothetical protein